MMLVYLIVFSITCTSCKLIKTQHQCLHEIRGEFMYVQKYFVLHVALLGDVKEVLGDVKIISKSLHI